MLCLSSSEIFERASFTWSRSSVLPFLTPTAIDVSSTEVWNPLASSNSTKVKSSFAATADRAPGLSEM